MITLLLLWFALLVALAVFAIGRPGQGGALTLAYFLGLSLIHVPGLLPFIDPLSAAPYREFTRLGFELTLWGMAAFTAGAILERLLSRRRGKSRAQQPHLSAPALELLGWRALTVGAVSYFILLPISRLVPSLTSVIAGFATLLVIGLWLRLYAASLTHDRWRTLATLALLPLLPLATLVTGGFIGYGVYWVLSTLAFLFVISRRRIWFYLATPLVLILGLSLFVSYMGQRTGIRDAVWNEHASLFDRLVRTSTVVTDFHVLDLNDSHHVAALNNRLNQNWLVGAGVEQARAGQAQFQYGMTIQPWALIPRAIWPDKPAVGGGGQIVSQFTGIVFGPATSVGAGQVLEFYINFGVPGVIIGFAGLGFILLRLDHRIMRALAENDIRGLLLHAMPGLTLLQPGGNLMEILVALAASIVCAHLILSWRLFRLQAPAVRSAGSVRSGEPISIAPRRG